MSAWWIVMRRGQDVVGARLSDDEPLVAQLHWNAAPARLSALQKPYTYEWATSLHPMQVQEEVIGMAGFEAGSISDLRFIKGDVDWDTYWKGMRGE